jgi:hypothetical protein
MNRLKSIIARRVYVCICVCGALFKTKRERGRESFDLSECIWHNRTGTVVVAVEKRRETPSTRLVDRKSPFFIPHPSRPLLALRSLELDTRLHLPFVRCSSVQYFSGPCLSMFSLSLSLPHIKTSIAQLCSEHIKYKRMELTELTTDITDYSFY